MHRATPPAQTTPALAGGAARTVELTVDVGRANWVTENGSHGSHWTLSRKRRALKELGYLRCLNVARGVHMGRAHVTAFVQYPSNNRADPTNAGPTAKPIVDGFTLAGLWTDDDSTHVLGPDFRRESGVTGVRGLHRIRFVIEEVCDE
jgi:crossover junction endodeoxyribonuclease RusA